MVELAVCGAFWVGSLCWVFVLDASVGYFGWVFELDV
jgi:hypothetical protein